MKIKIVLVALACFVGHSAASGYANAADSFQLVKNPEGVIYKLTPAQLKGIAAAGDDKPCKPKCLIILAFGREYRVPVGSLNAYIVPATTAQGLIKGGSVPVEARWQPPPSP